MKKIEYINDINKIDVGYIVLKGQDDRYLIYSPPLDTECCGSLILVDKINKIYKMVDYKSFINLKSKDNIIYQQNIKT